jgi:hypothetical protein
MNNNTTSINNVLHSSKAPFSQELLLHETVPEEVFHLSGVAALDRIIALALLALGVVMIISGFILSMSHSICGISRLLLGIAPALAGGYHAYCLEAWRYEAHLNPAILRQRCTVLYLLAATLAGAVLSLRYCS